MSQVEGSSLEMGDDEQALTPANTTAMRAKRRALWIMAAALTLLCTAGVGVQFNNRVHAQERADQAQVAVSELTSQRDAAGQAWNDQIDTAQKDVNGYDKERVTKDRTTMTGILDKALTWKDGESYQRAREAVIDAGISDKEPFLTDFMPVLTSVPAGTNPDGTAKLSNVIDITGANMRFSSFTTYVTSIDGGDYHYLGVADVAGKAAQGDTAISKVIVEYVSHPDGSVSDVKAWSGTSK